MLEFLSPFDVGIILPVVSHDLNLATYIFSTHFDRTQLDRSLQFHDHFADIFSGK
jgi:hypothetical protein